MPEPIALCQCGCGLPAPIAKGTNRAKGRIKGQPVRFVAGHNNRLRWRGYSVEDRGYTSPCWVWNGHRNDRDYPQMYAGPAYRVLWEREHGPVPVGLELDHLCRVRACVNPDHLEPVTHAENTRRAALARPSSTLIGAWRCAAGLTQQELARLVGCSQSLVSLWERGIGEPNAKAQALLRVSPDGEYTEELAPGGVA